MLATTVVGVTSVLVTVLVRDVNVLLCVVVVVKVDV